MNPFSYGTVVKKPYFYNREEELRRIVSTLAGGNNIVLIAPRRFGKTSLVLNAADKLEEKGFTSIYFDFMPVFSRESFIEGYTKAIMGKQGSLEKGIKSFAKFIKGIRPKLTFDPMGSPEFSIDIIGPVIEERVLGDVIDLPERLAGSRKKFILIIDEFQEIVKLNGENFENLFRSRIQHHRNVSYLFLGSKTHMITEMFSSKHRAFYNSGMLMNIGPLPIEESIKFLTSRFAASGIKLEKETALFIIERAGNIPYYIQLLSAEIWQNVIEKKRKIKIEIVEESARKIVNLKKDYYMELFGRQSKYQKKLLKALTMEGENIFSSAYAAKYRLSTASTTQKAAGSLIEEGLIEKEEAKYYINDPFFKEFISHYA
jgi:uncharacterized protein